MKRFVTTLAAWIISLTIIYALHLFATTILVGSLVSLFLWSPLLTLFWWGRYLKRHYDDRLYIAMKHDFPSLEDSVYPKPSEEVTSS